MTFLLSQMPSWAMWISDESTLNLNLKIKNICGKTITVSHGLEINDSLNNSNTIFILLSKKLYIFRRDLKGFGCIFIAVWGYLLQGSLFYCICACACLCLLLCLVELFLFMWKGECQTLNGCFNKLFNKWSNSTLITLSYCSQIPDHLRHLKCLQIESYIKDQKQVFNISFLSSLELNC